MTSTKRDPLKVRVERRRLPLLASESKQLEVVDQWIKEDHKKLLLLCNEFEIADGPQRFYKLALALARKHYIGFQERTPLGKWTDITLGYLVVEIERLTADKRKSPSHTASWAADVLASRPEWAEFLGGNAVDGGEALRVQYQSFRRNRWAAVMRDAYKWQVHQNKLAEWPADVIDALRNPHGQLNM